MSVHEEHQVASGERKRAVPILQGVDQRPEPGCAQDSPVLIKDNHGRVAVGLFVTFGMYDGFGDIFARAAAVPKMRAMMTPLEGVAGGYASWVWLTVLSMLAIMFLPRQFQIAVVENVNENHLRKAIWLFPLYMLAMNLFVVPIAFGGVIHFSATGADPDTFVLTLPMAEKQEALALHAAGVAGERAVRAGTNERVAIRKPLRAGDESGEKIALFRRRVAPRRFLGTEGLAGGALIVSFVIDGKLDLVDRGDLQSEVVEGRAGERGRPFRSASAATSPSPHTHPAPCARAATRGRPSPRPQSPQAPSETGRPC